MYYQQDQNLFKKTFEFFLADLSKLPDAARSLTIMDRATDNQPISIVAVLDKERKVLGYVGLDGQGDPIWLPADEIEVPADQE